MWWYEISLQNGEHISSSDTVFGTQNEAFRAAGAAIDRLCDHDSDDSWTEGDFRIKYHKFRSSISKRLSKKIYDEAVKAALKLEQKYGPVLDVKIIVGHEGDQYFSVGEETVNPDYAGGNFASEVVDLIGELDGCIDTYLKAKNKELGAKSLFQTIMGTHECLRNKCIRFIKEAIEKQADGIIDLKIHPELYNDDEDFNFQFPEGDDPILWCPVFDANGDIYCANVTSVRINPDNENSIAATCRYKDGDGYATIVVTELSTSLLVNLVETINKL